jgi:hypothetical protein
MQKPTYLFTNEGEVYKTFPSLKACADFLQLGSTTVQAAIARNSVVQARWYVSYNSTFIKPKKKHRHNALESLGNRGIGSFQGPTHDFFTGGIDDD